MADRTEMLPKPMPPEGGWKPPGEIPYVDDLPLLAWVSWSLESAGCVEEDAVACALVELAGIASQDFDPSDGFRVYLVECAVHQYVEGLRG